MGTSQKNIEGHCCLIPLKKTELQTSINTSVDFGQKFERLNSPMCSKINGLNAEY